MKRYLRYLAVLLCICMLVTSLSSCLTYGLVFGTLDEMVQDLNADNRPAGDGGATEEDRDPFAESPLEYTLSEDDRQAFDAQLAVCRALTLAGTDKEAIDKAWEDLEAQYYHIATQAQIAYILYCYDLTDERLSDAYLYASDLSSAVYADYMALCQEIDVSNSPYRNEFFEDWTEEELEEMRAYSEELSKLYEENDRILIDYRALDEKDFDAKAAEMYLQTVVNNNRIAKLKGYSDYYQYAYDKVYLRDYGAEDAQRLHQIGKNEVLALYKRAMQVFSARFEKLNSLEKSFISSFLYSDYDDLTVNYVMEYVGAAPEGMKDAMLPMFDAENSLFTDSENSYAGAFTGWLYEYERPFCYFGPDYQSSNTVIHELGHYYAEQFHIEEDLAMDLAEVHSQGNEMLFLAFLKDHITKDGYDALSSYLLMDVLLTVIMCMVIDEFEMKVYQNADQIAKPAEDLDAIMRSVVAGYGGDDYFLENVADPYRYWRRVTLENPVYYISYAVSGIAAIELYAEAITDYDGALRIYQHLVEESVPSQGFLSALQAAGLLSPFASETYDLLKHKLGLDGRN